MAVNATTRANFIAKIGPLIQVEAKKRGYKVCSPVIAQALCEGNFGESTLAKKYQNHFGLKCGSSWKGPSVNLKTKEEYTVGTLTTIRDNFRVYSSMEEGVKGYFDFISTKRYANLKTAATPLEYCQNLKIDGYATSSKYVSTLMSYITTYGLTRFDWDNPEPVCPYKCNVKLVKRGSKGETVGFVQWHLCRHGYTVNIDKNFGPKTELAVCLFQKDHGLTVDGKAGIYTLAALQKT